MREAYITLTVRKRFYHSFCNYSRYYLDCPKQVKRFKRSRAMPLQNKLIALYRQEVIVYLIIDINGSYLLMVKNGKIYPELKIKIYLLNQHLRKTHFFRRKTMENKSGAVAYSEVTVSRKSSLQI